MGIRRETVWFEQQHRLGSSFEKVKQSSVDLLLHYADQRFRSADVEDKQRWQRLELVMGNHITPKLSLKHHEWHDKFLQQNNSGLLSQLRTSNGLFEYHYHLTRAHADKRKGSAGLSELIDLLRTNSQIHFNRYLTSIIDGLSDNLHVDQQAQLQNKINVVYEKLTRSHDVRLQVIAQKIKFQSEANNFWQQVMHSEAYHEALKIDDTITPRQFFKYHGNEVEINEPSFNPNQVNFNLLFTYNDLLCNNDDTRGLWFDLLRSIDEQVASIPKSKPGVRTSISVSDIKINTGSYSMVCADPSDEKVTNKKHSTTNAYAKYRPCNIDLQTVYAKLYCILDQYQQQSYVKRLFRNKNRATQIAAITELTHALKNCEDNDNVAKISVETIATLNKVEETFSQLPNDSSLLSLYSQSQLSGQIEQLKSIEMQERAHSQATTPVAAAHLESDILPEMTNLPHLLSGLRHRPQAQPLTKNKYQQAKATPKAGAKAPVTNAPKHAFFATQKQGCAPTDIVMMLVLMLNYIMNNLMLLQPENMQPNKLSLTPTAI